MNNWITKYYCINCDEELSYRTTMHSNGRCPLCGFKHPGAGTIVETYEIAAKWHQTAPWWQFWGNQGYWQYYESKESAKSKLIRLEGF